MTTESDCGVFFCKRIASVEISECCFSSLIRKWLTNVDAMQYVLKIASHVAKLRWQSQCVGGGGANYKTHLAVSTATLQERLIEVH